VVGSGGKTPTVSMRKVGQAGGQECSDICHPFLNNLLLKWECESERLRGKGGCEQSERVRVRVSEGVSETGCWLVLTAARVLRCCLCCVVLCCARSLLTNSLL
jgi:hypothetical protein